MLKAVDRAENRECSGVSAAEGTPLAAKGKPPVAGGVPCAAEGTPSEADGRPIAADGTPFLTDGTPSAVDGTPFLADGTPSAADGTPFLADGTPSAVDGTPLFTDGKPFVVDGTPPAAGGTPSTTIFAEAEGTSIRIGKRASPSRRNRPASRRPESTNHQQFKGGSAMSQRVRAVGGFDNQSADQLITAGGVVLAGLTNNPAFPSPPVDLQTLQSAVDGLNAALAAQAHAGLAATAEKNSKQAALTALLRKLQRYVEDNCGDDVTVLLSSGFQAAADTHVRGPLENPAIVSVDYRNGELVLKVAPVRRAKCYEVRMASLDANSVLGPLQPAGLFTNSRSMTISGLTPGMTYMFQVRAIGGSTGYSDWSNPVSRIAA
jgi:hypothetical protein